MPLHLTKPFLSLQLYWSELAVTNVLCARKYQFLVAFFFSSCLLFSSDSAKNQKKIASGNSRIIVLNSKMQTGNAIDIQLLHCSPSPPQHMNTHTHTHMHAPENMNVYTNAREYEDQG
jgi:hypothetical protein